MGIDQGGEKKIEHRTRVKGKRMGKGLIMVYTGDGKGKTTAAVGLGVRAVGAGLSVLMVQFIKDRPTGELESLKRLGGSFEVRQMGAGFTWEQKGKGEDRAAAMKAWEFAMEKVSSGKFGMLILDEVNIALHYDFIPMETALYFLKNRDTGLHVLLTGRNAGREIIDLADTVTEMKEIKHHFHSGIQAQAGIEF